MTPRATIRRARPGRVLLGQIDAGLRRFFDLGESDGTTTKLGRIGRVAKTALEAASSI